MMPSDLRVNEHINLSKLKHSDAEQIVHCLNDIHVAQWLSEVPYPYDINDAKKFLFFNVDKENATYVNWAVRDVSGNLLGVVGLKDVCLSHKAEVGYWLANPYWGQGIMSQVVKEVCNFGFDKMALVRIYGYVFSTNIASARVLEKCGFEKEGILRKAFARGEKLFDGEIYALVV